MPQSRPRLRLAARGAPGKVRIIGGSLRGSKLAVPDRADLRPTPDRVRETLFNWLAGTIDGARCLDLYAGTGALGIEALSRGAASCTFVERDRELARTMSANLERLKVDRGRVECADAASFLGGAPTRFDLVFLDPPFNAGLWEQAAHALETRGWLADPAYIYLERPTEATAQLPADAVQGSTARGSTARAVDSSESSPGVYRTRRVEKVHDGLFPLPGNWSMHREGRAGDVRFGLYRRSGRDPLS